MRWILGLFLLYEASVLGIPDHVKPVSEDFLCMAWVVKDEARGEPVKGQRAVLDVVLKRMEKKNLSACEVIKQKKQFSGFKNGMEIKLHKNVEESDLTRLDTLFKMDPVVSQSDHFHAQYVKPTWQQKMNKVMQVGKHIFYIEKEKQ